MTHPALFVAIGPLWITTEAMVIVLPAKITFNFRIFRVPIKFWVRVQSITIALTLFWYLVSAVNIETFRIARPSLTYSYLFPSADNLDLALLGLSQLPTGDFSK
jgi:hypothetical protein